MATLITTVSIPKAAIRFSFVARRRAAIGSSQYHFLHQQNVIGWTWPLAQ
jgi:hypothetical protein